MSANPNPVIDAATLDRIDEAIFESSPNHETLAELIARYQAERDALMQRIEGARMVVFVSTDRRLAVVVHRCVDGSECPWRSTYFDITGRYKAGWSPTAHAEFKSFEDAVVDSAPGLELGLVIR